MRKEILLAAAKVFEERGYSGSRLQDVLESLDISKGALYFHFRSKEALAAAVVQESCDQWSALVDELRPSFPRAMQLLVALSWRFDHLFQQNVVLRAGIRLALERNLIGPSVPVIFRTWALETRELLAEARAQGDLSSDVDLDRVAGFLVAALAGLQQASATRVGWTDAPPCVYDMWRLVLPSLLNDAFHLEPEHLVPPGCEGYALTHPVTPD